MGNETSDENFNKSMQNLNRHAQARFNDLKQQLFNRVQHDNDLVKKIVSVDKNKLETMLSAPIDAKENKIRDEGSDLEKATLSIEDIFEKIDSFELGPELSQAIALIVSSEYSERQVNLMKAARILEGEASYPR